MRCAVGVPSSAEGRDVIDGSSRTVSETEGTSIGVGDEEARPQAGEDYRDDADTTDEEDWEDWEESGEDEDAAWDDAFDEEQEGEHTDESEGEYADESEGEHADEVEDEYADESEGEHEDSMQMSPKMSTKKLSQTISMEPTARSQTTIRLPLQAPVKTARTSNGNGNAMQTLYRQPAPLSSCHLAIVSLRVIPRPIAMSLRSS